MESITATELPLFQISFGADKMIHAGVPVLAGDAVENLFGVVRPSGRVGAVSLFRTDDWLLGAATVPLSAGLEDTARHLYDSIIAATWGWHLVRVWNYVPAINETCPGGLENYHLFCRGRSLAFEEHFGPKFKTCLPAASAVGCHPANLTITFVASLAEPRHVENPLQVPAYDYPDAYGPRPPSFARATVVPGSERSTVFISGTAAIRGFATVAPDSTTQQLVYTLENLRELSGACGLGPNLDHDGSAIRHFKIYLRHASDQRQVAAMLEEHLLKSADRVSYLQADICRATLLVEIEATLLGVTFPPSHPLPLSLRS